MSKKVMNIGTAIKSIKSANSKLVDATLALAYHSLVKGNIGVLVDENQSIADMLHRDYKALVCAKWNKSKDGKTNGEGWAYNKEKAVKLLEEMGLTFQVSTYADFVVAIEARTEAKKVAEASKTDEERAAEAKKKAQNTLKRLNKDFTAATLVSELLLLASAEEKAAIANMFKLEG